MKIVIHMYKNDLKLSISRWDSEWATSDDLDYKDKLVMFKYNYFIKPWLRDLPIGSSVCEIGCGNGQWLSLMNSIRPDLKYSGIDISTVGLNIIKKKGFNDIYFDICKTYEEYPKFDAVFSWGVIEHMPVPELSLYNHFRMAKKFITFDVPSKRSPATKWLDFRTSVKGIPQKEDWITNGMRYSPKMIKDIVERLCIWNPGWDICYTGSNYSVFPHIHPLIKNFDLLTPDFVRSFLGHNHGIILKNKNV
tara:strand:- start:13576 stop:14322 length:747 start_codon:yes stop_codon:yes gene_type:complete